MDVVCGLPRTSKNPDVIWVVVDRLTKSAHFIPIRMNYSLDKLAKIYVNEIVRLHGVLVLLFLIEICDLLHGGVACKRH